MVNGRWLMVDGQWSDGQWSDGQMVSHEPLTIDRSGVTHHPVNVPVFRSRH
jgi:hypothetical protein